MNDPHIAVIRPMTEADLEAVLIIEQSSFPTPWRREHFEHELSALHSFPFVAECNGIIYGYVCVMSLFEVAQILDIAVAPEQRGLGTARVLMETAVSVALEKGAELMELEVRASNKAAIRLYTKLGFDKCGVREKYYESSEDAILMIKTLKETT